MLPEAFDADLFNLSFHGVWVPAFAGTTMDGWIALRFSEHSSRRIQTLLASLAMDEEDTSWNVATS
jgi:hypothetical protein